ncbi:MAG: DUF5652 family protein [Parcubacteria group bacterium]|jgi:methionyl-tRNA synthetase
MNGIGIINYLYANQWLIAAIVVWSLIWKGIALWKAARNQSIVWYLALLVINTLGILEIIYIFIFSKDKLYSDQEIKSEGSVEKKVI